jgi:ABC-type branched-subunit amino acid transport system ATPase component
MARTFQGLELWEDISVEDNIRVGQAGHGNLRVSDDDQRETLDNLLRTLTLEAVRHAPVRELSQGQRQLVSIARSLASQPELVLLDEPAGGLDSTESRWLAGRLRAICESGATIVVIDHDMGFMLDVSDEIHVLDLGELIASGTPEQIRRNPRVTEAYLGTADAAYGAAYGSAQ